MKTTRRAVDHQRLFVGDWQASCLVEPGKDYDGDPCHRRRGVTGKRTRRLSSTSCSPLLKDALIAIAVASAVVGGIEVMTGVWELLGLVVFAAP